MTTAPALDVDLKLLEHDGQHPQDGFFATAAEYAYFRAGRGCGKTLTLLFDGVDYAQEYDGSVQLLTEPSWQQIERVMLPTLDHLYGRFKGGRIDWGMSPPIDIRVGDSLIYLAAADTIDENRVRGMNLARLLMDEAAQGRQEAIFHLASACVRDTSFPNQRKFTSTPQGRNWLWRIFTGQPLPGAKQFVAYSVDAERAGFVPEGWVEERALELGGWDNPLARQELLAQEIEMAGQVHPQFSRDKHVRALPEVHALTNMRAGIDFGGISPTALEVGGLDAGKRVWLVDEWAAYNPSFDALVEAIGEKHARWKFHTVACDPSGKEMIRSLNRIFAGSPRFTPAQHGNKIDVRVKLFGSRLVVRAGGPGMYVTPSCPMLISDVEGLMWARRRLAGGVAEQLKDEFDPQTPDHAYDAACNILAEWDMAREPFRRFSVPSITGQV